MIIDPDWRFHEGELGGFLIRLRMRFSNKSMAVVLAMMMLLSCTVVLTDGASASSYVNDGLALSATPAVPTAPLNLVADAGNAFVWLWWEHPADQGSDLIKNYTIYRNATSSAVDFVVLDTVQIGYSFPYNDTTVMNGVQYYYRITADSDAGAGPVSNVASVTPVASATPPGAVQNLVAVNNVYSVQLNWTSPTTAGSNPIRYIYVYSPGLFGFPDITILPPTANGYLDDTFVLPGATYNYTVRAISSTWGEANSTIVNFFMGGTGDIPGSPENLTALGSNNSVFLIWDNPANPSSHGLINYTVWRSDSEAGPFAFIGESTTTFFYFPIFSDMTAINGNKYYYRVVSNTLTQSSLPSNIANATPIYNAFPPFIDAYPGNGQVVVAWSSSYNATGYDIYRSTTAGVRGDIVISFSGALHEYWYDNSTTNGAQYFYTVRENLSGVYLFSEQVSATPYVGSVPSAPMNLIATPDSSGVGLYANLASSTDVIIGYSIYRGDSTGAEAAVPIMNESYIGSSLSAPSTLMVSDASALDDVNHYYYVTVRNLFGESPHSNEAMSFASSTGDVPDPVSDLTATGGSGQVTLTWNKPTYQGTANLLEYTVLRFNGTAWNYAGSMVAGLGQQTFVDTSLESGISYQYYVDVMNNYGGTLVHSNIAQATTTTTDVVPSAPNLLPAVNGTSFIRLSWSAPTTVGTGILNYSIFRGTTPDGEGTTVYKSVSGSTLTYDDTTVTAGQTYYYKVKAVNLIGSGPDSNEVSGMTPVPTAPTAPLGLTAFASAGQIQLNWSAPSSVGTGLTEYRVFRSLTADGEGTTPNATVTASTRTYIDTNVVAGTLYYYKVRAVNAAGVGPDSNEASAMAVTVVGVPTPPRGLTAVAGSNNILLNWTAPTTVGAGISAYRVYRGVSASGAVTPVANLSGTTLNYNDTPLPAGVPYYYVVKAVNENGTSDPSNEVTATVINPSVPTTPKNVVATPGAGQIVVTWDAPDSIGASAISGYQIFRSVNGSQLTLLGNTTANTRTFTDTNVDTSHSYGYAIVANNANGSSIASTQVTAVPNAPAATTTDNTALYAGIAIVAIIVIIILAALLMMRRKKPMASAPVGLTALTSAGKIQLNWSTPTNVGGGITEYRIYRGTKAGAEGTTPIGTVPGAARTFTDQTVIAGTSYYYVVRAVNSAGEGVASNEVSATADKS